MTCPCGAILPTDTVTCSRCGQVVAPPPTLTGDFAPHTMREQGVEYWLGLALGFVSPLAFAVGYILMWATYLSLRRQKGLNPFNQGLRLGLLLGGGFFGGLFLLFVLIGIMMGDPSHH